MTGRVVLSGPRATREDRAVLLDLAHLLRTTGYTVTTPFDVRASVDGADWDSVAYARAKAEVLLDADAVFLAPGWETCPHALASRDMAECLETALVFIDENLAALVAA